MTGAAEATIVVAGLDKTYPGRDQPTHALAGVSFAVLGGGTALSDGW